MKITVEELKTKTPCSYCGSMFYLALDVDLNTAPIIECPDCNCRYAIVVDVALVSLEPEKMLSNAKPILEFLAKKYQIEKEVEAEIAELEREAKAEKAGAEAGG